MPSEETRRERDRNYVQALVRGFVSIEFSGMTGVVRTLSGHANSVALAIDNLEIDGVLGTVAGDDTVFVALADSVDKAGFLDHLRERFPSIDI
jgi:transcriptional regulator of arginine metabolism